MTGGDAHSRGIEYLVERLEAKGREPQKNVLLYDHNYLYSDADVMTIQYQNGLTYLTRYEVKTGNGRKCAKRQAKRWFRYCDAIPNAIPRFVYYNTRHNKIERWRPPQYQPSIHQNP